MLPLAGRWCWLPSAMQRSASPCCFAWGVPSAPSTAGCNGRLADQRWFMGIFLVATALGLVAFTGKSWLAPLFLLVYLVYVRRELKQSDSHEVELPEPLKLAPNAEIPPLGKVLLQTLAALVVVALAAQLFVHQLESVGELFGLSPVLAALLLSPVATEMPELMNVLIWVRQGKNRLALANISGAMMIRGTIPKAFRLLFTPGCWMAP